MFRIEKGEKVTPEEAAKPDTESDEKKSGNYNHCGIRLLATQVLLTQMLLIRKIAKEEQKNLHLGIENWLPLGEFLISELRCMLL